MLFIILYRIIFQKQSVFVNTGKKGQDLAAVNKCFGKALILFSQKAWKVHLPLPFILKIFWVILSQKVLEATCSSMSLIS